MSMNAKDKVAARQRRHRRVRKRVVGTKDRLRLSVFRSNRYLYCQIIDDLDGRTVVAASTLEPTIRARVKSNSIAAAKALGAALADFVAAPGQRQSEQALARLTGLWPDSHCAR